MHSVVEILTRHSQLTARFVELALGSVVVLGLTALLCTCWRKTSAATRHLIWFLGLLSLGLLPLLGPGLPESAKPLWRVESRAQSAEEVSLTIALGPIAPAVSPRLQPQTSSTARQMLRPFSVPDHQGPQFATHFRAGWARAVMAVWLCGVFLRWVSAATGCLRLRAMRKRTQGIGDTGWADLLWELREQLGIQRTVLLLESEEQVMPVTWGCWRPVILLPKAATDWDGQRRRIVLLHELAHVRRWDCLTQGLATVLSGVYWFNPLAWLAARRMTIEREAACDDVVLSQGCRASEYATHLVEIALGTRARSYAPAIPVARSSTLDGRIKGILSVRRVRGSPGRLTVLFAAAAALAVVVVVAAQRPGGEDRPWFDTRLRGFFVAKRQQANAFAEQLQQAMVPEVREYFEAGVKGDWDAMDRLYREMSRRRGSESGEVLRNRIWSPVVETHLAWQEFTEGERRYVMQFGEDLLNSIPPGSIYLARSDPGRALVTMLSQSHAEGNPFFTLAQNAFADRTYLEYLQATYGDKLQVPSKEVSQDKFQEYVQDAQRRLHEHKLKPGESVVEQDNRVHISGPTAIMQINGLLSKWLFDHNSAHEFYVEESSLVDWMYPYLSPTGLVLRLNRQPSPSLPEELLRADHEYWSDYVQPLIGDWLTGSGTVEELIAFVQRVYLDHNYSGFNGDRLFVENHWAQMAFSRLRGSIAGVYLWRADHSTTPAEKARMEKEADFALRQSLALCPSSQEAVLAFVNLLNSENRTVDSARILQMAQQLDPDARVFKGSGAPQGRETALQSFNQLQVEWRKAQAEVLLAQRVVDQADEVITNNLPITSIPQVAAAPVIQALVRELAVVDADFADLKKRYQSSHPSYVRAQEKVSLLREMITNRALTIVSAARNTLETAKAVQERLGHMVERQKKQLEIELSRDQGAK